MNSLKRSLLAAVAAVFTAACTGPEAPDTANGGDDAPAPRDLHRLLAESDRPAGDKARDAGRKPADVIAFLGIEPGMRVLDVIAAGGVFGIIDHAGSAVQDNAALHRVEIVTAIETAEAAGFVVEARSDLLGNPADDHTQGVFAEGLRGNTDRFLLRLRKPAD